MSATQQRYAVRLMGASASEVGEMSEMQLFGYLNNRLPDGHEPEEVIEELARKGQTSVTFGSPLGPRGAEIVRVERAN